MFSQERSILYAPEYHMVLNHFVAGYLLLFNVNKSGGHRHHLKHFTKCLSYTNMSLEFLCVCFNNFKH